MTTRFRDGHFGSDFTVVAGSADILCTVTTGNGFELQLNVVTVELDADGAAVSSAEAVGVWPVAHE